MLTLSGLHVVNFRGIRDVNARGMATSGVVLVPVAAGEQPADLSGALRFAFLGGIQDPVASMAEGTGYAYVEVAFELADRGRGSIFRGIDRRGVVQVSLREGGGARVTGGDGPVAERLEEILGVSPSAWAEATWPDFPATRGLTLPAMLDLVDSGPAAGPRESRPDPAAEAPPNRLGEAEFESVRARCLAAVEGLRRALHGSELARRGSESLAELEAYGGRLRRSRTETSLELDRLNGERDRVRARLRRINEYRDLVAEARSRAGPVQPPRAGGRRAGLVAEAGLAAVSVAFLLGFLWAVSEGGVAAGAGLRAPVAFGLGFLFAGASFVAVYVQRRGQCAPSAAPPPGPDPAAELRASLAQRFEDLGDPEDPSLVPGLRARLSELDAEAAPLHARLESLDEAVAVHDVELGRACRALHRGLPPREDGPEPLGAGEALEDAPSRISALGDSVYRASGERDALLAGGVTTADVACVRLRAALGALGFGAGDPQWGDRLVHDAGLERVEEAGEGPLDPEVMDETLGELVGGIQGLVPAPPSRAAPAPPAAPPRRSAVAEVPALARVTAGRYDRVLAGSAGETLLSSADIGDAVGWNGLPERDRRRIATALMVAQAHAAVYGDSPEPRLVVLGSVPPEFDEPDDLARTLGAAVGGEVQVVLPA